MFVIATLLVIKSKKSNPIVPDFGPMHVVWLVATNQQISRRIAEVPAPPSTNDLRQAGMLALVSIEDSESDEQAATKYHEILQHDADE